MPLPDMSEMDVADALELIRREFNNLEYNLRRRSGGQGDDLSEVRAAVEKIEKRLQEAGISND